MSKSMIAVYVAAGVALLSTVGVAQKRTPETSQEKQLLDSFKGPELYKAYCATCHGRDGKGNGPTAACGGVSTATTPTPGH